LRPKLRNHSCDFVSQITIPQLPVLRLKPETQVSGFEAKPQEP
jgi:hypothetical protein